MELEVLAMSETDGIVTIFSWESRPAVRLKSGASYAVVSSDGGWVKVNSGAMAESAIPISSADFAKAFPMSDLSKVPGTMSDKEEIEALIDWEGRPAAILKSGRTFAVLDATSGWVSVSRADVSNSGNPISAENFSKRFPKTDLSKIPTSPSPISPSTVTVPSPVAPSSPKNKAHSVHEYAHTYKDSEDRWLSEAVKAAFKKDKPSKPKGRRKKGKKDKDR